MSWALTFKGPPPNRVCAELIWRNWSGLGACTWTQTLSDAKLGGAVLVLKCSAAGEGKMMERLNAPNQADSHVSAGGSVTFATRRLLGDICPSRSRSPASVVRDVAG